MPEHTVKSGDTVPSIAARHHLDWEKVWRHEKNTSLRNLRKDPHLLYPGDRVYLPEREHKTIDCATNQRHRFTVKGKRTRLRLRLLDEDDQPLADADYRIDADGQTIEGRTDGDGNLDESIPSRTRKATLTILSQDLTYALQVGGLDPTDQVQGLQDRLKNLGYYLGRIDNDLGPKTAAALRKFQQDHGLEATGQADAATLQKLEQVHVY